MLLTERPLGAGKAYWFVYPEARVRSRLVRAFGEWLKAEAATPSAPFASAKPTQPGRRVALKIAGRQSP